MNGDGSTESNDVHNELIEKLDDLDRKVDLKEDVMQLKIDNAETKIRVQNLEDWKVKMERDIKDSLLTVHNDIASVHAKVEKVREDNDLSNQQVINKVEEVRVSNEKATKKLRMNLPPWAAILITVMAAVLGGYAARG